MNDDKAQKTGAGDGEHTTVEDANKELQKTEDAGEAQKAPVIKGKNEEEKSFFQKLIDAIMELIRGKNRFSVFEKAIRDTLDASLSTADQALFQGKVNQELLEKLTNEIKQLQSYTGDLKSSDKSLMDVDAKLQAFMGNHPNIFVYQEEVDGKRNDIFHFVKKTDILGQTPLIGNGSLADYEIMSVQFDENTNSFVCKENQTTYGELEEKRKLGYAGRLTDNGRSFANQFVKEGFSFLDKIEQTTKMGIEVFTYVKEQAEKNPELTWEEIEKNIGKKFTFHEEGKKDSYDLDKLLGYELANKLRDMCQNDDTMEYNHIDDVEMDDYEK